jgi:hypothetical protein
LNKIRPVIKHTSVAATIRIAASVMVKVVAGNTDAKGANMGTPLSGLTSIFTARANGVLFVELVLIDNER